MGRELGCKTTGCMMGALIVALFFWGMMSVAEREAGRMKKMVQQHATIDATQDLAVLYTVIRQYVQEHNGALPPMSSPAAFQGAMSPRYADPSVGTFVNQRDKSPYLPNPGLDGKKVTNIAAPAETILIGESNPLPDGKRRAMFADGTLREVDTATWDAGLAAAAKKPAPAHPAVSPTPHPAPSPAKHAPPTRPGVSIG